MGAERAAAARAADPGRAVVVMARAVAERAVVAMARERVAVEMALVGLGMERAVAEMAQVARARGVAEG